MLIWKGWIIEHSGESLTDKQILGGLNKEQPTIFWSSLGYYYWAYDFKIAIKGGQDIWCQFLEIDCDNHKLILHFYRH